MGYVRFAWPLMWCGLQPSAHQFVKTLINGMVLICADGLCNRESHGVISLLGPLLYSVKCLQLCLLDHTKAAQRRQLKKGTCNPWTGFCVVPEVYDTACCPHVYMVELCGVYWTEFCYRRIDHRQINERHGSPGAGPGQDGHKAFVLGVGKASKKVKLRRSKCFV